jgi:DNA-binding transcriptional regulator YdaS (Cro superfamily)
MERRRFNQVDAATHIGIHTTYMSQLLSGVRSPGLGNALKIERTTGIPVEAWAASELGDLSLAASETAATTQTSK